VAITAEPLFPSPIWATFVGAVGSILVFCAIFTIEKIKIDDPVAAISVHSMWGIDCSIPFQS